jgi:hypothetical protein
VYRCEGYYYVYRCEGYYYVCRCEGYYLHRLLTSTFEDHTSMRPVLLVGWGEL